jgi:hypothetical protein
MWETPLRLTLLVDVGLAPTTEASLLGTFGDGVLFSTPMGWGGYSVESVVKIICSGVVGGGGRRRGGGGFWVTRRPHKLCQIRDVIF